VAHVAELWRYPVKSMGGERVEQLAVAGGGAAGDRRLAVVDPAAGKVLSAKRWPDLLLASASLGSDDRITITLPGGSEIDADDPALHETVSAWLDHDVRVEPPPTDRVLPMEMHTGLSDDQTPLFDWSGPLGTWLDLADAHWLTTASLRSAASHHPEGDWDVRRFRPTALIEDDSDRWPEDGWSTVEIGPVGSEVTMPTPRCTLPPRAQRGLPVDRAVATTLRDVHDGNLGVYARITRPGTITVGDPVVTPP
jgi:uncharacterized protein YcbX